MHTVKLDNPKDLSGTEIFLASKASDFINDNFLLENKYAEELYHNYSKKPAYYRLP